MALTIVTRVMSSAAAACEVLPAGALLDRRTGEFFWQPGVGFAGVYDLIFVRISGDTRERIPVKVTIRTTN